jgi:hypothetical protein
MKLAKTVLLTVAVLLPCVSCARTVQIDTSQTSRYTPEHPIEQRKQRVYKRYCNAVLRDYWTDDLCPNVLAPGE